MRDKGGDGKLALMQEIARDSADGPVGPPWYRRAPLRILTRYILAEVAAPTALSLLVIGFLAISSKLREKIRDVDDLGFLTAIDIAQLLLCFLPTLVTIVIPVAYMMGVLMAFGQLSQRNAGVWRSSSRPWRRAIRQAARLPLSTVDT